MTETPPPPRTQLARGLLAGAVVFVATLILLFGLSSLVGHGTGGVGASASSVATAFASIPSSAIASLPDGSGASPSASTSASPSGGTASPAPSLGPSASPSGDPVLVGAGDIATCGVPDAKATAALIQGIPGTVFTAGDNAYPDGTTAQFTDCYGPTWGQFRDRTRPAAGNHDWVTKGLAGYLGYFGTAAAPDGESWYSYDLGTWHVIVLDSDCSFVGGCAAASAQGRWLAADLAASKSACTLAIWHQPRFSSGVHGNDAEIGPFWKALYAAGADVVINGHDHDYERFGPQDPNARSDGARGIREFVVGTGGAELTDFPTTQPNSELRTSVSHGVMRLVLHADSYDWRFIPTTGNVTDAGSGPCH